MLKRSRDTAEYYMAELSRYVLEANDNVNYVLRSKQASAWSDAASLLNFLPTGLANRISLIQAMKPDPRFHVTMTLSKATRLFSHWSNSGKSSSFPRDSRAFSSATAQKSLACEATLTTHEAYAAKAHVVNEFSNTNKSYTYTVQFKILLLLHAV